MKNVRNQLMVGLLMFMLVICLLTILMPSNVLAIDNSLDTLMINTTALPDGTKTYSYNTTMEASGGLEPYTWQAFGLPLGLSIDSSSGLISGIPTPPIGYSQWYTPQFVVIDANGITVSKYLDLIIYENHVRIIYDTTTRPTLPSGHVNMPYSVNLEARYGMEPYTWSVQNLPTGLQIDSSTGIISGVGSVSGGPYYVTVTVKEPDNYSHSVIFGLTIEKPPIASFTITHPIAVAAGEPILVDATSSYHPDPNRVIVSYEWDWDASIDVNNQIIFDSQDAGIIQSHLYPSIGYNRVALRITDDVGQQAITSMDITVEARRAPIAIPGGPYEITWGEDLFLDGSRSYDPDSSAGDSIVRYSWDIDYDSVYEVEGVTPRVSWSTLQSNLGTIWPANPETGFPKYPIRLKVTDTTGREHTGITTVTIWEVVAPPAASIDSTEPITLSEATLNDGSLAPGVIVVTIVNGSLAADITKEDVTTSNLPAGLDYTVTWIDETHVEISIIGNATNHTNIDDINNLTFTIAQAKVTRAESDLTTTSISIDYNDPPESGEVTQIKGYPDAPAIATKLLKAASIKHNYIINGVKGNYIADVARMKKGNTFNGVDKSDYVAYVAAVEDYLESRGLVLKN